MNANRLFQIEYNNDRLDDLLDLVENGHPSIDESHWCYNALTELESYDGCQWINLYNNKGVAE